MRNSLFRNCLSLLLSASLVSSSTLLASDTVAFRSSDCTLGQDGTLAGTVVNHSGQPVAGIHVHVLHQNRVVATVVSDPQGDFSVNGLRHGAHLLQIGATQEQVRFWSRDVAPPAAVAHMAIVVDEQVVRGQDCGESCGEGFCNSGMSWGAVGGLILIGGAVATTLALTLDNDDDRPASP